MGTRLVLHQPEYTVVHMYWYEYHHNVDRSWGGWHHSEIRLGLDIGGETLDILEMFLFYSHSVI